MIKDLEVIKFDFCFYSIENYNMYIYHNGIIIDLINELSDCVDTYDEFDTFWININ